MKLPLPPLREDLHLFPGATLAGGQPSYVLHDPARNQFFQLDWLSFEILARWNAGDAAAIATAVAGETPLQIGPDAVEGVLQFLAANQLLRPAPGQSRLLAAALQRQRGSAARWLLHNYLFFRIPLLRPDAWLQRWAGRLAFFFSPVFGWLTLLAMLTGAVAVFRDWERFSATLVDTLSWQGMAGYGVALAMAKVCHELGHAFTAKRHGCRVPTMGVAFLVLWPVAYTDTNEAWKLHDNRARLKIAAAGIVTELSLAAWATLAWSFLPDGSVRHVAFMLATTTWISTVLINASPFMRFDGYFLLSDLLQLPNLHQRAFALARWDLRERLFRLGEPQPEHFPPLRHAGLIAFAWAVWLYRLSLFLGIAMLVYGFFIKAVGILLFLVEIVWFVLLPIYHELREWKKRMPSILASRRAWISWLLALAALLLLLLPLPSRVNVSGVLQAQRHWAVYAPAHARLERMLVGEGQRVAAGTRLLLLASDELDWHQSGADARLRQLRWQAAAGAFDQEQRQQWQVLASREAGASAEMGGIATEAQRYAPLAPFAGVIRDIAPDLRPGQWLGANEKLALLVDERSYQVQTYVDEQSVALLAVGGRAEFVSDGQQGPRLALRISRIEPDTARTIDEAMLTSLYGGNIVVREKNGQLYPEHAVYRVTLTCLTPPAELAGHSWRGQVSLHGGRSAPITRYAQAFLALLWREAGF